jgi:hypothetical protein
VPDVRPCEVHKGRIVPGPKGGSFREDQGLFHGYLWMVGLNSPTDIGAYRSEVVPASPGTGSSASQSQQCGQLQSTEQKTRLETVSLLTKRPHRLSHLGDFLSTSHAHFGTVEINILVFIACHVSSANPLFPASCTCVWYAPLSLVNDLNRRQQSGSGSVTRCHDSIWISPNAFEISPWVLIPTST